MEDIVMKWIPVTERLPEVEQLKAGDGYKLPKYTNVLVTTKGGSVREASYTRLILRKKEVCRFEGYYGAYSDVTAWMLLPEPYKAG